MLEWLHWFKQLNKKYFDWTHIYKFFLFIVGLSLVKDSPFLLLVGKDLFVDFRVVNIKLMMLLWLAFIKNNNVKHLASTNKLSTIKKGVWFFLLYHTYNDTNIIVIQEKSNTHVWPYRSKVNGQNFIVLHYHEFNTLQHFWTIPLNEFEL